MELILQEWKDYLVSIGCIDHVSYEELMTKYYPALSSVPKYEEFAEKSLRVGNRLGEISDEECVEMYEPLSDPSWVTGMSIPDHLVKVEELLKVAESADYENIIDVGCGPCLLLPFLRSRGKIRGRIVGFDPSPGMLETAGFYAEKLGVEVELILGWMQEMPFPDQSFDLVVSLDSLHWTNRWRAGLREMVRISSKDFFLCYSEFSPRVRIPEMEVVKALIEDGLDIVEVKKFDAEKTACPRFMIRAKRGRPSGIVSVHSI